MTQLNLGTTWNHLFAPHFSDPLLFLLLHFEFVLTALTQRTICTRTPIANSASKQHNKNGELMLHRKRIGPEDNDDDDDDVHHVLRTMVYKHVFLSPTQLPEMLIVIILILQRTKLGFREWNELPRLIELGAAKLGFEPTISSCQMQQLRDLVSNLHPTRKIANLLYLLYSFFNVSHVSDTLLSFLCITSFGSKKWNSIPFHKLGQHGKVNEPAQSCTLLSGRAGFGPSIWLQGPPS